MRTHVSQAFMCLLLSVCFLHIESMRAFNPPTFGPPSGEESSAPPMPPTFAEPTDEVASNDPEEHAQSDENKSDASTQDSNAQPSLGFTPPVASTNSVASPTQTIQTTPSVTPAPGGTATGTSGFSSPASTSTPSTSVSTTSEHKTVSSGINFEEDDKEQDELDKTVDTLNVKSGGNWLLKRVWWEKTEDVYEQIKDVFNKVMDTRMQFISERNKLDRELDIFYGEMGIEQGPLQDLLSHAQDLMDKEKQEQGYLDKKETAFVEKLQGKERDLEQLKLDVKAIQELDNKIDEALDTLFKQIDVCNQYEQKAWDNFKEIARELNDKEARKLFYDTQGLYKDIQKVQSYISGEFATYFNQTIQSAREHSTKVSSQLNSMKSEGIDLVKEAEILEKDEPAPKKSEEPKKTEEPKTQEGWFVRLKSWLFNLLPSFMQNWFTKTEAVVEQKYEEVKKEVQQDYEIISNDIGQYAHDLYDEVERSEYALENYFGEGVKDAPVPVIDDSTRQDRAMHPADVHPSNPATSNVVEAKPMPTFGAPTTAPKVSNQNAADATNGTSRSIISQLPDVQNDASSAPVFSAPTASAPVSVSQPKSSVDGSNAHKPPLPPGFNPPQ